MKQSKAIIVQKSSVEADVLEVVVLIVVADRLDKWQCLLNFVVATELNLSHHVELYMHSRYLVNACSYYIHRCI